MGYYSMAAKKAMSILAMTVAVLAFNCAFASTVVFASGRMNGVVTAGSLNVRSGPGKDSPIVSSLRKNDTVTVYQTSDGWYKISIGCNKYGWVSADYIKASSGKSYTGCVKTEQTGSKKTASATKSKTKTNADKGDSNSMVSVTGTYTNLRKAPEIGSKVIKRIYMGTVGSIIQKNNSWYKIRLSDSKEGWVNKKYVKVSGYKADTKSSSQTASVSDKIIIKSMVNVRREPSLKSEKIATVRKNEVYEKLQSKNGWYKIISPSGDMGYVRKEYAGTFKSYAIDGGGSYIWPTQAAKRISQRFHKGEGGHKAVDIAAPGGSQIVSITSGKVYKKGYSPKGIGHYIVIKQDDGLLAYYCHMKKESFLSKGDKVSAGDTIGIVGSSGHSTGNHLHLELRKGSTKIDPLTYFPNFA